MFKRLTIRSKIYHRLALREREGEMVARDVVLGGMVASLWIILPFMFIVFVASIFTLFKSMKFFKDWKFCLSKTHQKEIIGWGELWRRWLLVFPSHNSCSKCWKSVHQPVKNWVGWRRERGGWLEIVLGPKLAVQQSAEMWFWAGTLPVTHSPHCCAA